jgi:hypothetical protein
MGALRQNKELTYQRGQLLRPLWNVLACLRTTKFVVTVTMPDFELSVSCAWWGIVALNRALIGLQSAKAAARASFEPHRLILQAEKTTFRFVNVVLFLVFLLISVTPAEGSPVYLLHISCEHSPFPNPAILARATIATPLVTHESQRSAPPSNHYA